jgi:hypothetical protein
MLSAIYPARLPPAEWLGSASARRWPIHLVTHQPASRLRPNRGRCRRSEPCQKAVIPSLAMADDELGRDCGQCFAYITGMKGLCDWSRRRPMAKRPETVQRRTVTAAALLATLMCGSTAAEMVRGQTAPGTWTMKAPLPAVRAEVAAVALGGKLHAIGGAVNGTAGPYHDQYEPASDTWRARAPLPEGRDHVGVATAGGKIYAFGGFVGLGHKGAGAGAFEYDPATDKWRVLPVMKAPRGAVGAAAVDGKIHVVGGRGLDGVVVATHEVLDPRSGRWSEAAPLPTARDHMAVIAVDGRIHAIGGRFKGSVDRTGLHDVYDPATDKWTPAAPLPTPRSGLAGACYRGLILVVGGELPPGHTFPENEGYDPKTDRWTTLAPMPHGRHGFGGDTIGDNAYFVGGSLNPGDKVGTTDQLLMFHVREAGRPAR